MEVSNLLIQKDLESDKNKTPAARVLLPLLDSLNWQGEMNRILEAQTEPDQFMTTDGLVETMASLRFKHDLVGRVHGKDLRQSMLPVLIVNGDKHDLILNFEGNEFLVFDGREGAYVTKPRHAVKGDMYVFQYAEDLTDSLVHQQRNWFNKLMYRFKSSIRVIVVLSLLITCLDLLIPVLIVLVYDQIASQGNLEALVITYGGVLLYLSSSYMLGFYRSRNLNYISTRMGAIISSQTFTRLMYLSPSYTETASINSQINRIKDFENLKRFVTSDVFIDLLELLFSIIYVIAIFVLGGWIGFIPIITFVVVVLLGMVMRPFHRIKMEKHSELAGKRQQSLIEILKYSDDIKSCGLQDEWMQRYSKVASDSILQSYELSDYVNTTKSISYFLTNASVLAVVYFGALRILSGQMSMGLLIGIILLYWKVLSSIRGAFNLSVQVNGLVKSIAQINRFMNLPQDSSLKTSMVAAKQIKGIVKFRDVSLRYSKNANPALRRINFDVYPSSILGITGHDGAGKTSILKLLMGMYKPQGGRILLDGNNIKELEPLSLRKSISYSSEKDVIFSGTIRENFTCYNAQITDKEIWDKAEKTGLADYMRTLGYDMDTVLTGHDITKASLSFKKLFNITRTLIRDVNVYLFDEPENYLRQDEIERIAHVFKEMARLDRACIVISSKSLVLLQACHDVIKLDQGRIVTDKAETGRQRGRKGGTNE